MQLYPYPSLLDLLELLLIVKLREVLMLQDLFYGYSFAWVKFKHFADQVKAAWIDLVAEEFCSVYLLSCIKKLKECLVKIDRHALKFCRCWCSCPRHNFLNLIDSRCPWKQGLSIKHLPNQTSKCPYIDFFVIIFAA